MIILAIVIIIILIIYLVLDHKNKWCIFKKKDNHEKFSEDNSVDFNTEPLPTGSNFKEQSERNVKIPRRSNVHFKSDLETDNLKESEKTVDSNEYYPREKIF